MASQDDILTSNTNRNQAINNLGRSIAQAIQNAFPQASTSVVSTASVGTLTLPANPKAFLQITVGTTTYAVALYGT